MGRSSSRLATSVAALLALAACDAVRPVGGGASVAAAGGAGGGTSGAGGTPIDLATCTRCHGDASHGNAAPPFSLKGTTATSERGVGAHQQHLRGLTTRAPLRCDECHLVPAKSSDPGHMDSPFPVVRFDAPASTGLARSRGASPAWNRETGTCSGVYCHGATVSGGASTTPVWAQVDGSQKQCGSCHGFPPPAPHPTSTGCASCHPATVDALGNILVSGGKHIDGNVDVAAGHPAGWGSPGQHGTAANAGLGQCQQCHGADLAGGSSGVSCDSCHGGGTAWRTNCTFCHGDANRSASATLVKAAPPRSVAQETATTSRGVGAHQSHLEGGTLSRAIACGECHAVPSSVLAANHVNGAREITFGGTLASTGGAAPVWDGATGTCASTYCHGATLPGAAGRPAPSWTGTFTTGATTLGCTSCHGNPPAGSHPASSACSQCHTGYGDKPASGPQAINLASHVNGMIDVANLTCTSCHGTPGRAGADPYVAAAPPAGTRGETATSARAVGAHMKHLQDGAMRAAIACSECHALPSQQVHGDGTVTMTFGALAKTGGAAPSFNGTSCASTYCHGSTLAAGGTLQAPSWTKVDGTQAACGTCHGIPPPTSSGHPAVAGGVTACANCHPATVKADGTVDVAGGKHIDGTLQVLSQGCTSCHGDPARAPAAIAAAPPKGTHGETATTTRPVGAHQAHLAGTAVRAAIACSDCHTVPTSTNGHPTGTVDMTFGALAKTGGASPVFNGTTCASTYCHGATLSAGGSQTQPVWTTVDGTQRQCTSCHGAPPPTSSGHPAASTALTGCAGCHPATVKPDGTIDLTGAKHINGTLEVVSQSCTSCHGDPARTPAAIAPAPPTDTAGLASSNAVGAHLRHLQGGSIRSAMQCSDCHTVPTDSAHASQPLGLNWSALARSAGVVPSWNATTLTCTNYCHGISLPGGSETTPTWNQGSAAAACGTCHAIPPPTASGHPAVSGGTASCNACHPATVTSTGVIDLAGGKHVNGTVEVTGGSCTSCHGDANRTPVAGADANVKAAPPVGTRGETATSTRAVGAHQAHLNKSTGSIANPTACSECHLVPSSTGHSDGVATVTFGTLAKTGGKAPTWSGTTCSASYCHGNFTGGATAAAPSWTGGAMTCTSCHGNPPSSGQHGRSQHQVVCSTCHGTGYSSTAVNKSLHVNGAKNAGGAGSSITWNAATRSCAPSCHGSETW
jgi:predicted CxxxxCH...CXXCH cytochrome family protein